MKRGLFASVVILVIVSASSGFVIGALYYHPNSVTTTTATSNEQDEEKVSGVNVCWLGAVSSCCSPDTCGGTTPVNYTLKIGEGFKFSIGYDASKKNYTILSVYTRTAGFTITGIYWEGSTLYYLPQSVYVGTNFPFSIGIVATSNATYDGPVDVYIVTSSVCCYFNGTTT